MAIASNKTPKLSGLQILYNDLRDRIEAGDEMALLQEENLAGTVQTIAFDDAGNVQSITHKNGGTTVRTDTFTFAANSITEVRTLASGASLTIVTNTSTLETTVTYAAA